MTTRRSLAVLMLALAAPAHAILVISGIDHLKCYAAKDTAAKTTYTADLSSVSTMLPNEVGCRIVLPAKLVCDAVKATVDPPPPTPHAGEGLGELLACYKLKCAKQAVTFTAADEFGSRSVTVSAPKLVCAPANFGAD